MGSEPMRILYVSGSYVPSRRASSIHVMRMCAALARQGHEVVLVTKQCRERQEAGVQDDFAFYGVEDAFSLVKIPRPRRRGGGLLYLWGIDRAATREGAWGLLYCREPVAAWRAARRGLPVLYEAHVVPAGWWRRRLCSRLLASPSLRRLVVVSAALRDRFEALGLRPTHADTVVAHDAADAVEIADPPPADGRKPRAGYVGHLYPGRGVGLLWRLAERMPDCEFHLVGGGEHDLAHWGRERRPPNLVLHGFVPPARLAGMYGGFDVLLMPYQRRLSVAGGRADTSEWMSPMKLFEYMSTGRPIVSSDLPVLREVLEHERNALLVPPEDPAAWEAALNRLLGDPALRRRLGETARREHAAHHTWDARARIVLEGLDEPRRARP